MEDHRRYRPLRLRWFLLMGVFGLFFLGDVLKNFSYEKQGRQSLSETKTFFEGSDQEVVVYHLQGVFMVMSQEDTLQPIDMQI